MQAISFRTFLTIFILSLIYPSSLSAAMARRTALVIGNGTYGSGPLKNPVNDAVAMAAQLQKLGFTVILKKNANLRTMEEAMGEFGDQLKRGGVGLFFYAGHGLQVNGVNYLIPIGAKIDRELDVKYEAMNAEKVLDEMVYASNGLNIVILDACRDNPFARSFRSAARGLAIVSKAPAGTIISYSTGPGEVARDGDELNSPFTQELLKYMQEPGLGVESVFKKVRATLGEKTGGKQIPWELSSLQGDFFFVPISGESKAAVNTLEEENQRLEAERSRLEKEWAVLTKQKELDEKRRQIEEERERQAQAREQTVVAMGPRLPVSGVNEIGRDGRFIAYNNGTVLDTRTNLMWASRDNGSTIDWVNAKRDCKDYRGGGYSDWRMPTQDELAGLYDAGKSQRNEDQSSYPLHLTELIDLTSCCLWASETQSYHAAFFDFNRGYISSMFQTIGLSFRALPVRSGK